MSGSSKSARDLMTPPNARDKGHKLPLVQKSGDGGEHSCHQLECSEGTKPSRHHQLLKNLWWVLLLCFPIYFFIRIPYCMNHNCFWLFDAFFQCFLLLLILLFSSNMWINHYKNEPKHFDRYEKSNQGKGEI